MRRLSSLVAALVLLAGPASARTLLVGPGRAYQLPSHALAAAQDGDTVSIAPGEYFDCAIVRANELTIQGEDESSAVITDKICEEKAILVLRGNGITVRNLTLRRARAPDGNGAGIRLEASNLAVDHVVFENDQVGILSGVTGGEITVADSRFNGGGVGGAQPKFAVMVGHSASLRLTGSSFTSVKGGQVTTAADRSQIAGNAFGIGAGTDDEAPSYAVLATNGAVSVQGNVITVESLAPRSGAAIGLWDGATGTIRDNRLVNHSGQALALVKDWSWSSPALAGNTIGDGDTLTSTSGILRHRASALFYAGKAEARSLASQGKQVLKHWLGR